MPKHPTHNNIELAALSLGDCFKSIVDNSGSPVAIFSIDGYLKYSNRSFRSLWNIDDEKGLGSEYNLFLDKRFASYYDRIRSLNSDKNHFSTSPHTFKIDGSTERIVNVVSHFSFPNYSSDELILTQDISDPESDVFANSEKNINKVNAIKNAFEVSSIIIEFDLDGILIGANDQFYKLSAYNPKKDLSISMLQLRSGNMPASFYDNLWATILKSKTWKGEMENRSKKGDIYWTESTIIPQQDEEGVLNSFLSISSNITERKLAEKEIIKLNVQLEKEVEKRTEDIKDAVGELEAFSYSVSHDLRAPLRAITGFSGLLKEEFAEDMNEDAFRYLKIIENGTRQMAQLIDDLLQFSRVGRIELQKNLFDPHTVINEIINKEELNVREELEIKVHPMPNMHGDAKMLKLVFTNLILNALKFSKDVEFPIISIGAKKAEGEDIFYVKDNGVGFDMRYADKLFKVFQRLHSANEFEGTGVGLAIVSRIIHKHGGRVWGESLPESNTSFYFTIPHKEENE